MGSLSKMLKHDALRTELVSDACERISRVVERVHLCLDRTPPPSEKMSREIILDGLADMQKISEDLGGHAACLSGSKEAIRRLIAPGEPSSFSSLVRIRGDTLREKLIYQRKHLKLSRIRVAERAGISQSTVIKFESGGSISYDSLEKIMNALILI